MSELMDLAFRFCSKAKEKDLKKCEVLWLVDVHFIRLEGIETQKRMSEKPNKGGD